MDVSRLDPIDSWSWTLLRHEGESRADVRLYSDAGLLAAMDDKVLDQITNVARLGARRSHPYQIDARRRGGGAWSLQRCQCRGGGDRARGTCSPRCAARAADLREEIICAQGGR